MSQLGPVGPTHPTLDSSPTAAAVSYDRHIAPFAAPFAAAAVAALLEHTPQEQLRNLLDHGAGTGQVARLLHDRLPVSTVLCLDPSADLLQSAPCAPNDPWSTLQHGTALDLDDQDLFDACVSNLVLPFTTDTVADLRRIRTSLRPGAPMVAVTLGNAADVEPFHEFWSAHESIGPFWVPQRYVHFRFGDEDRLRAVFAESGFADLRLTTVQATRTMSPEAVWEWLSSALPVGMNGGYVTPDQEATKAAESRFLERSTFRESWTTRCLLMHATA